MPATSLTTPSMADIVNPFDEPGGRLIWGLIFEGVIRGSTAARAGLGLGQRAELTRAVYRELQASGVRVSFPLPQLPEDPLS